MYDKLIALGIVGVVAIGSSVALAVKKHKSKKKEAASDLSDPVPGNFSTSSSTPITDTEQNHSPSTYHMNPKEEKSWVDQEKFDPNDVSAVDDLV